MTKKGFEALKDYALMEEHRKDMQTTLFIRCYGFQPNDHAAIARMRDAALRLVEDHQNTAERLGVTP